MGNLKPAPIFLTESVVAKLCGDQPAYGAGIARVPVEGVKVDQPRLAALHEEASEFVHRRAMTMGSTVLLANIQRMRAQ